MLPDERTGRLGEWLGLTNQQFELLVTILKLQKKGATTNARNILEQYSKERGAEMQGPNFFTQMKVLINKCLVVKDATHMYVVDTKAIKRELKAREKRMANELEEFKEVSRETDDYLKDVMGNTVEPDVGYLTTDELFYRVADVIRNAKTVFISSIVPRIYYTKDTEMRSKGIAEYANIIWARAINGRDLELFYLTPLDVSAYYNMFYAEGKDHKLAYEKTIQVAIELGNIVKRCKNIRAYIAERFYGVDMIIPKGKDIDEFFLLIRDKESRVSGGISLKSTKLEGRFTDIFMSRCKESIPVDEKNVDEIIDAKKKEIKEIYSRHNKK